jgi:hypothetical protein
MCNENITREKLAANGSIPSTKAPKLKDIQKNRKEDLEECAEELQDQVLMPLQKVIVACLIEAYRDQIGLGEWKDRRRHSRSERKSRREWERTVKLADLLLWEGVVRGKPLDVVLNMVRGETSTGEVSAPVSNRVPEAIANGLEAALKLYLPEKYLKKNEARNENPRDYSRDRILEEAKPMYFSWRAARLMYRSAAQNESFEELISRILPGEDPSSFLEDGPSEDNSSENNSSESLTRGKPQNEKETLSTEELISEIELLPDKEELSKKDKEYIEKLSKLIPNYTLSESVENALSNIAYLYEHIEFKKQYSAKKRVYEDVFDHTDFEDVKNIGGTLRRSLENRDIKDKIFPGSVSKLVNLALVYDHIHGN